ncbi:TadE family type IV pilus minor pilin [Lentzea sp. BCCO 10_0798]|uniref:TadE family type IV pilus minor pilin n=1 Tax=Lentzea kristufekii TaxID=3095430 RepID=A0ABU4TTM6_9PSEU|nr:TadE family type IV pilus minor pilin [Lentzea sp. BCCO 10_0798]MDX8051433.1 TadE family type IV pilus minor pilin [Lentzea sp. BCCO 10_0798]
MVTVEAAIAVSALLVAMWLGANGLTAVTEQMRCTDAAREAARLTARGERQRGEEAAGRIVANANVLIDSQGDAIKVVVSKRGPLGLPLSARAFAVPEPR